MADDKTPPNTDDRTDPAAAALAAPPVWLHPAEPTTQPCAELNPWSDARSSAADREWPQTWPFRRRRQSGGHLYQSANARICGRRAQAFWPHPFHHR